MDITKSPQSEASTLQDQDPELYQIIELEYQRQNQGLELIASENFTSEPVLACLGSILTNKYAEGQPGKRYYGGNQYIDEVERLCQSRALEVYRLDPEQWAVNVQPYSGSVANLAAYNGLIRPHDRIMGLDLPSGGHLTHGYYTAKKRVSATSVYYESLPYHVDNNGYLDMADLEATAKRFKPKLIICGGSAYPRDWDYAEFSRIAKDNGAYLLCDMAHISGLVATQEANDPFEYCDVVTTTTHKTLRGPRSGMIFMRKELERDINSSVFPGLQGGPHEHQIAGVATQLREVQTPEFKQYIQSVKANAKSLGILLTGLGYRLSTGGTDNHLLLVDLRDKNVSGSKVEKLCELADISINKNSVKGDKSAMIPGGIRIGLSALTTRGLTLAQIPDLAELLDRAIRIAAELAETHQKLIPFTEAAESYPPVAQLRQDVQKLAQKLNPVPRRPKK